MRQGVSEETDRLTKKFADEIRADQKNGKYSTFDADKFAKDYYRDPAMQEKIKRDVLQKTQPEAARRLAAKEQMNPPRSVEVKAQNVKLALADEADRQLQASDYQPLTEEQIARKLASGENQAGSDPLNQALQRQNLADLKALQKSLTSQGVKNPYLDDLISAKGKTTSQLQKELNSGQASQASASELAARINNERVTYGSKWAGVLTEKGAKAIGEAMSDFIKSDSGRAILSEAGRDTKEFFDAFKKSPQFDNLKENLFPDDLRQLAQYAKEDRQFIPNTELAGGPANERPIKGNEGTVGADLYIDKKGLETAVTKMVNTYFRTPEGEAMADKIAESRTGLEYNRNTGKYEVTDSEKFRAFGDKLYDGDQRIRESFNRHEGDSVVSRDIDSWLKKYGNDAIVDGLQGKAGASPSYDEEGRHPTLSSISKIFDPDENLYDEFTARVGKQMQGTMMEGVQNALNDFTHSSIVGTAKDMGVTTGVHLVNAPKGGYPSNDYGYGGYGRQYVDSQGNPTVGVLDEQGSPQLYTTTHFADPSVVENQGPATTDQTSNSTSPATNDPSSSDPADPAVPLQQPTGAAIAALNGGNQSFGDVGLGPLIGTLGALVGEAGPTVTGAVTGAGDIATHLLSVRLSVRAKSQTFA